MSRTRWKMMIGALGLGLGGLAAIADTPPSCAPTVHKVAKPPALPTLPPMPSVPPVPAGKLNAPATPLELPSLPVPSESGPSIPPLRPMTISVPTLPPVMDAPKLPASVIPERAAADPGLKPAIPAPSLAPPLLPDAKISSVERKPAEWNESAVPKQLAMPDARVAPAATTFDLPPAKPTPLPALSEVKAVAVSVTPAPAEKKLKVMLHMGDERPKFEVRDGEVVYLRVTSEKVDVKSPADAVEANLSTMRAAGKVRFVTPGGEGTCDELAVVPGSGQVTVTGNVAFTYSWGKVETTVTGEKMTFRLGDAPAGSR